MNDAAAVRKKVFSKIFCDSHPRNPIVRPAIIHPTVPKTPTTEGHQTPLYPTIPTIPTNEKHPTLLDPIIPTTPTIDGHQNCYVQHFRQFRQLGATKHCYLQQFRQFLQLGLGNGPKTMHIPTIPPILTILNLWRPAQDEQNIWESHQFL